MESSSTRAERAGRAFGEAFAYDVAITSRFRADGTAHGSSRAIDLAPRSGPVFQQRRALGRCPFYYLDATFLDEVRTAARAAQLSEPSLSRVLVEADHVHLEVTPDGTKPAAISIGTYTPPLNTALCQTEGLQPLLQEKSVNHDYGAIGPYDRGMLPGYSGFVGQEFGGVVTDEEGGDDEEGGEDERGGYPENLLADMNEIGGAEEYGGDEEYGGPKRGRRGGKRPSGGRRSKGRQAPKKGGCGCCPTTPGLPYGFADRGAGMGAGVPFFMLSRGIQINSTPIPLFYRAPADEVIEMMRNSQDYLDNPSTTSSAPVAGAYSFPSNAPTVGRMVRIPFILIDVGPVPLSATAGGVLTIQITGRYIDGTAADLGTISLQLPSTVVPFRMVVVPYRTQQLMPVPQLLYVANAWQPAYLPTTLPQANDSGGDVEVAVPIPAHTQTLIVAGTTPGSLQINVTIPTPSQPGWQRMMSTLQNVRRPAC